MTQSYFVELDGHDEPTLWAREDEQLVSILRRCDLPYPHHWDELVARVIAGNPDAQVPETIAESVKHAGAVAMAAPYKAARLEHIQGQIIANAVTEAEFRGRLDRALGEAWAAGYREAEYERNQAE